MPMEAPENVLGMAALGRASAGRRRQGRCYAAEVKQDAHDHVAAMLQRRACEPRGFSNRAARVRGAMVVLIIVVARAPAAGGLVVGGFYAPPSQAVLRLRGGTGGVHWPWRSHAGSSLHHSGARDQVLGILVPLATVALKKVLGMTLGFILNPKP